MRLQWFGARDDDPVQHSQSSLCNGGLRLGRGKVRDRQIVPQDKIAFAPLMAIGVRVRVLKDEPGEVVLCRRSIVRFALGLVIRWAAGPDEAA